MSALLIANTQLVNEGQIVQADVLIEHGRFARIDSQISAPAGATVIDAAGRHLLPGMIDDQVHFREPGLTHKGDFAHESRAAVAGGVTSIMEMPNSGPPTLTAARVEEKLRLMDASCVCNHACYLGASNDNLDDVREIDPQIVAGIKVFMGSSTGNMLVDDPEVLDGIFRDAPCLVATHCEDTPTIAENEAAAVARWGDDIPADKHPAIRSVEACWKASSLAVELAKQHGTRLHVLHLTSARELALFDAGPADDKRITAEVCVHHLWFCDADYARLGHHIKCNPAIKTAADRAALRQALLDDKLDVVATDHAPHTVEEKHNPYTTAPSGIPLVQHALPMLASLHLQGVFPLERIVEKYAHAPARLFGVEQRGYIREGWHADCCLLDLETPLRVDPANNQAKCGWSPFDGDSLGATVSHTIVGGQLVYENGRILMDRAGERLRFVR
jgi:dihydroorotase